MHLNPFRLDLLVRSFCSSAIVPFPSIINAAEPLWPHQLWGHLRLFPSLSLGVDPRLHSQSEILYRTPTFVAGSGWAAFHRTAGPLDHLEAYFWLRGGRKNFDGFVAALKEKGYDLERVTICVGEYSFEEQNEKIR